MDEKLCLSPEARRINAGRAKRRDKLLPVVEVGMSGGILIFAAGLMIYVSIITLLSFAKSTTDRKLMLQGLLSSILVMLLYSTFIQ